jgi:hypothetical protein
MLKLISVPAAELAALEGQGLATAGSENSSDPKPMASPTLQPQMIALFVRKPLAVDNWDELSLPQATLWDIARSKRPTAASDNLPSVE